MSFRRLRLFLPAFSLVAAVGLGESRDVPLTNWTVPPYRGTASAGGGLSTMTDVTPGIGFVGVAPCRLVDTRQAGFPAGYGQPALAAGAPRNFDLNSQPNCTGIPAGVDAYSLNFTVTNTQGPGFLKVYPQGGSVPLDVSTINYVGGQTIANAAIVPAGTNGGITVIAGVSGTDVIIDINGYFTDQYNAGVSFHAMSTTAGDAIFGENTYGVFGGNGVHGKSVNGYGVYGESTNNNGVVATSAAGGNSAVWALNTSAANGSTGVFGWANSSSGATFGGKFETDSPAVTAAGVKGVGYSDPLGDSGDCDPCHNAGVRGVSTNYYGVLGISRGRAGVGGVLLANSGTTVDAAGYLGHVGFDPDLVVGHKFGVFADGDIGATGVKYFLDPHPTDPSLIIQYVALEGPEAGTYFRGRGRFQNEMATIEVPDDFRMVTDPEGLSVQVTPIGEMATVAVISIDLSRIVIRGSRNVEFFYTVNGVRSTFKNIRPIRQGAEFRPEKADATLPGYLSETQKQILIRNGTYKPDGIVNMETARRLGWDKVWEKREKSAPQTTP
jgi:hypothetical protein